MTTMIEVTLLRVRLEKAERERDEARRELGEILAIIHRDGGHHTGKHGISKSVADAHATWADVVRERDEAHALIDKVDDELAKALGEGWFDGIGLHEGVRRLARKAAARARR